MEHKYLTFVLALLMSMAASVASAHDFEVDGIYYRITSSSSPYTVEATYRGRYYYYYSNEYTGSVTIPESVTYNSTTYSVTSIGEWAFYDCYGLTSVTIPNSVTSIGGSAFSGCSSLTSVSIPNSVTSIGNSAFHGTAWYDNQPDGLVYVGKVAYKYKGTMPEGTSIVLEEGTVGIAGSTFSGCSGLTSIIIPNSVTSIGAGVFSSCSGLETIVVNSGNTVYDSREGCNAIIETASNTLIAGCKNTIIPNNVTSIGNSAFVSCSGLTSVTIPNSVTSIGEGAFYYCSGLTSVTIPNSVNSIGENAFRMCDGLKKAEFASIESLCGISFADHNANPLSYAHHLYIDGSEVTDLVIPNSVTSISSYAFDGCSGLTSITIPNSVTSIGTQAFYACSGLISVTIPNSVTSISSYLFSGCSGLTSIDIPNSVTSIGESAFLGCSSLTAITIPTSMTSIGYRAFYGCSGLTSVTIPSSVTSIGSEAFHSCTGLTSVSIPNSVTSIGNYAFLRCSSLTSVTIPNSVTSIGSQAFMDCSSLETIVVNSGNTVYDSREGCNAIIKTASNTLIWGCKNTIIPNSVKSIDNSAFSGCTGLTSVSIPNSVTSIGHYAFNGCTRLTSITIPNSVTSIGERAFYSCSALADVYCFATDVPIADYSSFETPASLTLHVPASSLEAYKTTNPWSNFGTIVALTDEEVGVKTIDNEQLTIDNVYDLSGRQQRKMQKGINIIRMSDGTTKKVLVK